MPDCLRPVRILLLLVGGTVISTATIGCAESGSEAPVPPVKTATDDAPPEEEHVAASDTPVVADSERQGFDGLEFVVPSNWEKVALSQFQMGIISAKFQMPDAGPDVTLTLSRSGGGIEANLDRWRGQVEASRDEVTETLQVANADATLIDMEGRFAAGFGREPEDGWRMIGVVVDLPDQGYFLKLTGPVAQVKKVEPEFREFIKSATRE